MKIKELIEEIENRIKRIEKCCGYPTLKKEQEIYCPFCFADIQYLKAIKQTVEVVNEQFRKEWQKIKRLLR